MRAMSLLILLFTSSAFSQTIHLTDYNDYPVTDVASKGLTSEGLFNGMNRKFINVRGSICSNRALMWANDFKRKFGINTAKIFLFFTASTGNSANKTWWYHVSPMVNERGSFKVVDAGFSKMIYGPQTIAEWLVSFVGEESKCKEIGADETDLFERMFRPVVFPEKTSYGKYNCYYRITPEGNWTPESVAKQVLGRDADGNPVNYVRDEIDSDELYTACVEATESLFGTLFGSGKKKCKKYVAGASF
jgi:hypothetical protein